MSPAPSSSPSRARPYSTLRLTEPDAIRLLHLATGPTSDHDGDALIATLFVAHLGSPSLPAYEALSYVWGGESSSSTNSSSSPPSTPPPSDLPSAITTIVLNNIPFRVTPNLHAALHRLRNAHRPRTLWIDAVCINQADPVERAQQVGLMARIYSRCWRCVCWLGEGEAIRGEEMGKEGSIKKSEQGNEVSLEKEEKVAFEADTRTQSPSLRDIFTQMGRGYHLDAWLGRAPTHNHHDPTSEEKAARMDAKAHFLRPLAVFMSRAWWTRVWTLQEATLPTECVYVCGDFEISWDELARSLQGQDHIWSCCDELYYLCSTADRDAMEDFFQQASTIANARRGAGVAMQSWLMLGRARAATDLRDKVYGVLGLVERGAAAVSVDIDYTACLEDVYTQVTRKQIMHDENLQILGLAGLHQTTPGLPSWVVDWAAPDPLESRGRSSSRHLRNMLYCSSSLKFTSSGGGESIYTHLPVRGISVGKVVAVGDVMPDHTDIWLDDTRFAVVQQAILQWNQLAFEHCDVAEADLVAAGALCLCLAQTLLVGCYYTSARGGRQNLSDWRRIDLAADAADVLLLLYSFIDPATFEERDDVDAATRDRVVNITIGLLEACRGARLFVTETRRLGMAPACVEQGDEAWLLAGCPMPVLLRAATREHERSLVTDCFVQGVVDGELEAELVASSVALSLV